MKCFITSCDKPMYGIYEDTETDNEYEVCEEHFNWMVRRDIEGTKEYQARKLAVNSLICQ